MLCNHFSRAPELDPALILIRLVVNPAASGNWRWRRGAVGSRVHALVS